MFSRYAFLIRSENHLEVCVSSIRDGQRRESSVLRGSIKGEIIAHNKFRSLRLPVTLATSFLEKHSEGATPYWEHTVIPLRENGGSHYKIYYEVPEQKDKGQFEIELTQAFEDYFNPTPKNTPSLSQSKQLHLRYTPA